MLTLEEEGRPEGFLRLMMVLQWKTRLLYIRTMLLL